MREVHLLASDLPAISRRQIDGDNFIHFCVPLLFVVFLPELAGSGFELESDDDEAATLILERFGDRIESGLDFRNLIVNLLLAVTHPLVGRFCVGIKLLILRRLLNLRFALASIFANTLEVSRVALDEFALNSLPRSLAIRFVIQRPG